VDVLIINNRLEFILDYILNRMNLAANY